MRGRPVYGPRDAQVSIASAETLFRDGEYLKAKLLLTRAIDRNRRHEATSPKLVSRSTKPMPPSRCMRATRVASVAAPGSRSGYCAIICPPMIRR